MADEAGTDRAVHRLMERQGSHPPVHAAMSARAMLEAGDVEGRAVRIPIFGAVKVLRDQKPAGPSH